MKDKRVQTHGTGVPARRPGRHAFHYVAQHAHPAHAPVAPEVHALVEPLRGFVAGVDFEIERDATVVARDLHRCLDQLLADAGAAPRGLDVHLVEPGGGTAVLQRP